MFWFIWFAVEEVDDSVVNLWSFVYTSVLLILVKSAVLKNIGY
ncbi:hypothetical protein HanPSC8_Chr17g0777381 [Helianthus annuus]|nr:hypothetical protein HanPSC8_Chr17g0777381 [Helianthus annuus]